MLALVPLTKMTALSNPCPMHAPIRALVAEPDPAARLWLTMALERLDAEVTVVAAASQLHEQLFGGTSFDVVFVNPKLPGMQGLQVIARASSAGLRVPFVVIAGLRRRTLHVYAGEPDDGRLVSREVDEAGLVELARTLAGQARRVAAA